MYIEIAIYVIATVIPKKKVLKKQALPFKPELPHCHRKWGLVFNLMSLVLKVILHNCSVCIS